MSALPVEEKKPAVRIMATVPLPQHILAPILWGLEEEGIPAQLEEVSDGEAIIMAKQAAGMSPLNVGIGINHAAELVALHHRDLPAENPLLTLETKDLPAFHLRLLGLNAARLVKGEPLVLQRETEQHQTVVRTGTEPQPSVHLSTDEREEIVDLIVRVVLELLSKE